MIYVLYVCRYNRAFVQARFICVYMLVCAHTHRMLYHHPTNTTRVYISYIRSETLLLLRLLFLLLRMYADSDEKYMYMLSRIKVLFGTRSATAVPAEKTKDGE